MAIVGKRRVEEQIIPARDIDERTCDICGEDATTRTSCKACERDLCGRHQIDILRVQSGEYRAGEEWYGIYCKECLIAEINKRY